MITPKVWGFEDELVNADYCGKRIIINAQNRSSIHMHKTKDEVLLITEGIVYFESGIDSAKMSGLWMQENDRIRVRPGTWHRFAAIKDTVIFETSTHHDDADVIRNQIGGKIGDDEFRQMLSAFVAHEATDRVVTSDVAKVIADLLHRDKRSIGFCNGCFDLMHLGHVELLRQAKTRCEVLFVGVNTDASIQQLKGASKPYVNEVGRLGMVAANRYVDYVIPGPMTTFLDAVDAIKPDIYVTTKEYGDSGPEARATLHAGGKVEIVDLLPGFNSSAIAAKIAIKR